jgi:hypothetical protein
MKRTLLALAVAFAAGSAAPAAEDARCTHEDCVRTPYGTLEIKPRESGSGTALSFGGREVRSFEHIAHLKGALPDRERATLVLIEQTDFQGCAMSRILEVKSAEEFRLTTEFGNCAGLVPEVQLGRYGIAKSVVLENGEWRFAMAAKAGSGEPPQPEWYAYREGKVYREEVLPGRTAADPETVALRNLERAIPDPARREALIRANGSAAQAWRVYLLRKGLELDPRKPK